ncbi:MAG: alanine dehydrogenase, partial [Casimicrobiaceae bacterium]
IGVPRECKDGERRVGVTPEGARQLVGDGHAVIVESGAGAGVGFGDADYAAAGATIATSPDALWSCALIVKVKELQPPEFRHLVAGTTVFGFAQLNRDPALLAAVRSMGIQVIGYETVRDAAGGLPLLAPMSRIAGRLAPFVGAQALATDRGGAGVLLPGVDDVPGARVVVIGAGNVGFEATRIAARMGARVTLFSRGGARRNAVAAAMADEGRPVAAFGLADASARFEDAVVAADLVIGAVLEPGKLSPKLIPRTLVAAMRPGSVIVDVGIDHGGIAQTSRMTKLSDPTYVECDVVHYAVPNMPALVARTATLALTQATLPVARAIAGQGIAQALADDAGLAAGALVRDGAIVHPGLAADAAAHQANRTRVA